jgi:hypothetical protein
LSDIILVVVILSKLMPHEFAAGRRAIGDDIAMKINIEPHIGMLVFLMKKYHAENYLPALN